VTFSQIVWLIVSFIITNTYCLTGSDPQTRAYMQCLILQACGRDGLAAKE
jgi:hypothetical protein